MLDKISIAGFKSLLELQDLELGQVNVLIGANGSGKTSLLEAVGVLSAAAAGEVSDKELAILMEAIELALIEINNFRQEEGDVLAVDFKKRIGKILNMLNDIFIFSN